MSYPNLFILAGEDHHDPIVAYFKAEFRNEYQRCVKDGVYVCDELVYSKTNIPRPKKGIIARILRLFS